MQQLAGVINENQINEEDSNIPSILRRWGATPADRLDYKTVANMIEVGRYRIAANFILDELDTSVREMIMEIIKENDPKLYDKMFNSPINEVELSGVDKKMKDKYIQDYISYVTSDEDSEFNDDIADLDTIEKHAEEFGYTNTLKTIDKINNQYSKNSKAKDPLQSKAVGNNFRREPVITKKGKMHKYDVEFIKDRIKSNLGLDYENDNE
jgi:hypothetical protein